MKFLILSVTLFFGVNLVCATSLYHKQGSRIIGGQPVKAGQFTFAAAIHVQTNTSTFFCGGALIGNKWILTSGHCVYNGVLFTVQLGSIYLDSENENSLTVATSTYILYPDFDPDAMEHDIGIIELRDSISYNDYIQPIGLYYWNVTEDKIVRTLGWGQTSDDDAELSNELNWLQIKVISNLECQTYYGSQINENMVCIAGNYNEGTCTGDTGSPLFVSYTYHTIVGVASFISGNGCESTDPSGYTRIRPYYDWIRNIILN